MKQKSSLKSTIAVSLNNYLDAGAIVAGASGITLWQNYLGLSEIHLGWLNAISANALGAAIGAIIGGFLADKFGRKFIFTYNLLVYMLGVLIVMLSMNFPMLLCGFLVTGISVGVGVPASWTYISESSEVGNRGRNICISQMSWGIGPMVILFLGMLFAPGGYLFSWVEAIGHAIGGSDLSGEALNVFSSRVVFFSLFVIAFIAWNLQRQLEESAEFKRSSPKDLTSDPSPRGEGSKVTSTDSYGSPLSPRRGVGGEVGGTGEDTSILSNIKALFTNKIAIRTATYLAIIYLTWNLVASVMGFFLPHIYETAGGVTNEQANWLSCVLWFCTVATTAVLSFFIDRTSHKFVYILGLLFAIAPWAMVVTTGIGSTASLWAFAILWGIEGGLSVQIFYALWGSELFPARFRAGAQGLMFFLVRGLSAAWGLIFTFIYGENGEGFTLAAWCMIALLVVSLVVGVIGAPDTRGKSLAQITKERYGEEL